MVSRWPSGPAIRCWEGEGTRDGVIGAASATAVTAGSFQSGRVFLAGDSAHADHGFALLVEDEHERWRQAADDAGRSLDIPLSVHPLNPGEIPRITETSAIRRSVSMSSCAVTVVAGSR